jgi:heavy metal translocating P-type ATPase
MTSEATSAPRRLDSESAQQSSTVDCCSWCGLPITPSWFSRRDASEPLPAVGTATGVSAADPSSTLYCCSGCRFAHAMVQEQGAEGAVRWTIVRLGIAIFFTMNLMAFTMTMWSLDVYDVQPDPFQLKLFEVFRWVSMLFGMPVLLLLGFPLLQDAIASWKQRVYSTDLLIATGVIAAYATSVVNVVRGSPAVYFEVGAMVLVAVTLGRWFEAIGKQKATAALDQLSALLPANALKVEQDTQEETTIPCTDIRCGDLLRIRAGERFPVDAQLVEGRTTVDEQVFTGESHPIKRSVGDRVLAGTVNLDGDIIVRASAGLHEGSFSRLQALLQEARNARGHYQRLADRVSTGFFPVISSVAVLTLLFHLVRLWHVPGGVGAAIQHTLSVLLIACPCALGLATPLAVWTSLSTAIRHQVLFRSGEAIERLAAAEAICIDKTGTLTTGTPQVVRFHSLSKEIPTADLLRIASLLANASHHPYSRAITSWCAAAVRPSSAAVTASLSTAALDASRFSAQLQRSTVQTIPGGGVRAALTDGREVRLGSIQFVSGQSEPSEAGADRLPDHSDQGTDNDQLSGKLWQETADREQLSSVAVGIDGRLLAAFLLSESLRPEAASAIRQSLQLNLPITILTGDRGARGERLREELLLQLQTLDAQETGERLQIRSELQPEDKVSALREVQRQFGRTIMVGDGINDAPALAVSEAGIAMGCGADVSRDSAQVCLLGNDLTRIPWAIQLARRTRRVIRQNLFWAFGYNSAGVILAAVGLMNPAIAAGLMIVSSLLVITNSLRLMRFHPEELSAHNPQSVPGLLPGIPQPLVAESEPVSLARFNPRDSARLRASSECDQQHCQSSGIGRSECSDEVLAGTAISEGGAL